MREWKAEHASRRILRAVQAEGCVKVWVQQVQDRRMVTMEAETEADIMSDVVKAVGIVIRLLNVNVRIEMSERMERTGKEPMRVLWEVAIVARKLWEIIPPPDQDFVRDALGL